jgi:hypothetical protein
MTAMLDADSSRRLTALRPVSVALILVLSATAVGCGSANPATSTTTTSSAPRTAPRITGPSDLLVRSSEVHKVGERSPYGVLLRWWRALQSQDVAAARAEFAKSVDTSGLPREIRELSYPPRLDYQGDNPLPSDALQRSRPKRIEVTKHDGSVRMFTVINAAVFEKSDPSKVRFVSQTPTYFTLVNEGGKWKLANDDYLAQALTTRPGK